MQINSIKIKHILCAGYFFLFLPGLFAQNIPEILQSIDFDTIKHHVRVLSGDTTVVIGDSTRKIFRRYTNATFTELNDITLAEQYLKETLESFGYEVHVKKVYEKSGFDVDIHDLLVVKEGMNYPGKYVLFSAFYMGFPWLGHPEKINPSADMNASGVATVLEGARVLKNIETDYSIIFALWGMDDGAHSFTYEYLSNPFLDKLIFNVDVEAIGYDSLNLHEIIPQFTTLNNPFINEIEYIIKQVDSLIINNDISLIQGRPFSSRGYAQIESDICPGISFIQSVVHPDSNDKIIFNPHCWYGYDHINHFNPTIFFERAKAVIGTVAQIAVNGIPGNLSAESHPIVNFPCSYTLFPNYPNPFNASTTINFYIPGDDFISLYIIDVNGNFVEQLIMQNMNAGYHNIIWNPVSYSSGIYLLILETSHVQNYQKIVLMK